MSSQKIKEANLWKWLSGARDFYKGRLHLHRVENEIDEGTPDVEGHLGTKEKSFWIELKTASRPIRPTTPIQHELRPEQIGWLHTRAKAGGSAWILIQIGSGAQAKRYLIHARHAVEFQQPLTEGALYVFSEKLERGTPEEILEICAR